MIEVDLGTHTLRRRRDLPTLVLASMILVVLWLAAYTKIRYTEEFWGALEKVPLVPLSLVAPLSGIIVALEIVLPLGLLLRATRTKSAIALMGLFGAFLLYSTYRIVTGDTASCGCFHGILNLTSVQDAILDVMLTLMSGTIVARSTDSGVWFKTMKYLLEKMAGTSSEFRICGAAVLTASIVAGFRFFSQRERELPSRVPGISAEAILKGVDEFEGATASPATIVMFMDYQCDPCKEIHRRLELILHENPGKLKVAYRHFPISAIHPYAFDAAVAVEAARRQGKYWQLHRTILDSDLYKTSLSELVKPLGIDMRRYEKDEKTAAKAAVLRDEDLASKLGVSGTPTMFLCRPNGEVLRLRNSMDVASLL